MKRFWSPQKDYMWQDAVDLKILQILVYFMGVPIEDKANKVNLEYGVHWQVLQNNLSENLVKRYDKMFYYGEVPTNVQLFEEDE